MPRNGSVGLNGRARLCEDTYTNRPGEVVAASSTAAALEAAWAVRSAGTVTLSSADAGFVVREDGADYPIVLPYSWRVNGEGFGSRQFWVEKASGTAIGATGTFTLDYEPDVSGEELTASAEVTVVKIRVEAKETWPENRVRHIFGPREEATITIEPALAGVIFVERLRDHGLVSFENDKWVLTVPDQPGCFELCIPSDSGDVKLPFEVIPPKCINGVSISRFHEYDWFCVRMQEFSPGFAGVVANVQISIMPDFVSFRQMRLYETYAPPTDRRGWYADTNRFPDAFLEHNVAAGASGNPAADYMEVGEYGKISPGDRIGSWIGSSNVYSNGSYKLIIPVKWYTIGCSTTNELEQKNVQTAYVYSDGRMKISKFGFSWERQLYGNFEYPVREEEE